MNYDTVIRNIEKNGTATISHVSEVVEQLLAAYDDEQMENWGRLQQLMELLATAQIYNGNADHYHNLAVSLARADQYKMACDVLKIGLQFYGESIDLLADFLEYVACYNEISEGKIYFDKLMKIDKKQWNWRAFNFSIDYLSARLSMDSEEEKQKDNACIDELVKQFQMYHETDERAYFAEYTVAESRNEGKEAVLKLEKVISEKRLKAPRCTLKIAEYYFDHGNYESAEKYIKLCKTYMTAPDMVLEPGNIYVFSALCGICQLYSKGIDKARETDGAEFEKFVKNIYRDCEAAGAIYNRRKFSRYKELEIQRDILEKLSGIPYYE